MIIKLSDTRAFDDTKCVNNKTDPKCRWCVKSVDSCLLNECHKNISDHRRDARAHWGPKTCQYKVFLNKNTVKLKHNSKQSMISCTVNLIRLHKLRSFDNRSKIRILTSLIGSDMNKLTTSNDTIHSSGLSFTQEIL